MLLVAMVALLVACLVMILEWAQYGFQYKPPTNLRSASVAVPFDMKA